MGYFDGLTNGAFKIDEQGRRLFFLYGKMGKPRLLPDEAEEMAMRGRFKTFYKYVFFVGLPVIILSGVIFGQPLAVQLILGGLLILPPYIWLEVVARKYPKVDGKLTFGEAYANSAAGHNYWTLIALTVMSAVFVALGLLIVLFGPPDTLWIGIAGILFFGLCGGAIGYMARLKVKQRRAAS